ncbi:uncharacterized protein [Onthophagus taurus]|uniref:uncharacterized protein n=1 Tax=Onthophagus taurus TaxID=166361 RepID=UPI0039BE1E54
MKSSIVALIVGVLGLSATTLAVTTAGTSNDQCKWTCDVVKNGTVEWKNGVQIIFNSNVTITVSKIEEVTVIVNKKTNVVLAIDTKNSLFFIGLRNASFGLVIDIKTGRCMIVKIDINLIFGSDFTALREAFNTAFDSSNSNIVIISFRFIRSNEFNVDNIFISGDAETIAKIKTTYGIVFKLVFSAGKAIGKNYNVYTIFCYTVFDTTSHQLLTFSNAIGITITRYGVLTHNAALYIVVNINVEINLESFTTLVSNSEKSVDECISNAKNTQSVGKTFKIGNLSVNLNILYVQSYLAFSFQLGRLNINFQYTGTILTFVNDDANMIFAISYKYTFIYSLEFGGGFLFTNNQAYFVSESYILTKVTGTKTVDSTVITSFIRDHTSTITLKVIALSELQVALESESNFKTFCNKYNISNASDAYKIFGNYRNVITKTVFVYSVNVVVAFRVSFSLTFNYEVNLSVYNNVIVTGIATTCDTVSKSLVPIKSETLFVSLKLAIGSSN